MANYFFNDTRSSTATDAEIFSINSGDTLALGTAALWSSTNGSVLGIEGGSALINGQLYGKTGIKTDVGIVATLTLGQSGVVSGAVYGIDATFCTLTLFNHGLIYGATAILATAGNFVNDGVISGVDVGVSVSGNGASPFRLTNSGTINGGRAIVIDAGRALDIDNSGEITSGSGSAIAAMTDYQGWKFTNSGHVGGEITFDATAGSGSFINGGTIDDAVSLSASDGVTARNSGTIAGAVTLSDADDSFDSSGGHLGGDIDGGDGDDVIIGSADGDGLLGGNGDDVLRGGAGDDRLRGGAGGDVLDGGDGIDLVTFDYTAAGIVADLANPDANTGVGGIDTFVSIEGLVGNSAGDTLYGDAGANRLYGMGGNDVLDGRAGADMLRGGVGDDTFYVDTIKDRVNEKAGQGADTVISTAADYTLPANVETLILGAGAINASSNDAGGHLIGNAAANTLTGGLGADVIDGGNGADQIVGGGGADTLNGGAGNDQLRGGDAGSTFDGGAGIDRMYGGAGQDIYYVDDRRDVVIEQPGGVPLHPDIVNASASYTLPANVENLNLTGAADLVGLGNTLDNYITGGSGANLLDGGLGSDTMIGGAGADQFRFSTAPDAANRDTILDFSSGTDKLLFSKAVFAAFTDTGAVAASAFINGGAAQTPDQHLIYDSGSLYYDPDGSGGAAQVLVAVLGIGNHPTITAADLLIVG